MFKITYTDGFSIQIAAFSWQDVTYKLQNVSYPYPVKTIEDQMAK